MQEYETEDDRDVGPDQMEILVSYLAFAKRSLVRHWPVALAVFMTLSGITLATAKLWPRTYHCESRFIAQQNLFAPRAGQYNDALGGAADVMLRHESLETVINQVGLVKSWPATRPTILMWKDRVSKWIHGAGPSDDDLRKMLVGTVESKLMVTTTQNSVTIALDWQDPAAAAQLVEAVEQNFLESRHVAEISTIAEYISILESHAVKMRDEIYKISDQLQKLREERVAAAEKSAAEKTAEEKAKTPSPAPVRHVAARKLPLVDEDAARAKVMLEAKQRTISELEGDRSRRLLDLRGKLTELESQYTAAHPLIVDTRRTIESLSHESPQVTALRAEVRDLENELKRRAAEAEVAAMEPAGAAAGFTAPGPVAEPLPTEIMRLADDQELDPAVTAQFRYAVSNYTRLRDEISTARIDLDTAQVAFSHRYKIVVPPEAPSKAIKPKVPLVLAVGFFAALLLGAIVAIIAELRAGKITERWQVQQMELPVLAELRFPPASD